MNTGQLAEGRAEGNRGDEADAVQGGLRSMLGESRIDGVTESLQE